MGEEDPLAVGMIDVGIFLVLQRLPEIVLHEFQEIVEIFRWLLGVGPDALADAEIVEVEGLAAASISVAAAVAVSPAVAALVGQRLGGRIATILAAVAAVAGTVHALVVGADPADLVRARARREYGEADRPVRRQPLAQDIDGAVVHPDDEDRRV